MKKKITIAAIWLIAIVSIVFIIYDLYEMFTRPNEYGEIDLADLVFGILSILLMIALVLRRKLARLFVLFVLFSGYLNLLMLIALVPILLFIDGDITSAFEPFKMLLVVSVLFSVFIIYFLSNDEALKYFSLEGRNLKKEAGIMLSISLVIVLVIGFFMTSIMINLKESRSFIDDLNQQNSEMLDEPNSQDNE